ncbi:Peptide methionine sulfoxide reductase A5 [Zostera marina]|uniref:Peptide methionine sulfoxide reductase A5 n=1 Tax=Zostera marina TaxID=29655 RepID=A0A0K9P9V8_ZOSMR|nr:Peptide methionine sulfoxide reductase A5 [Zostera marina]
MGKITEISPLLRSALMLAFIVADHGVLCFRYLDHPSPKSIDGRNFQVAVFALGSFWRSEAVFGCLPGVVRTFAGYSGGSRGSSSNILNPEFRNLGDHAECVKVEYDPKIIKFNQLLDVFWSNHDSRQVYGQGPDVGTQYRSIIFTNGTHQSRLASASKEREQTKSRDIIVTTQIKELDTFYLAETEHQKFELKRNKFLLQLIGNLPDEELGRSSLATKLNSYAAELCPPQLQAQIDAKIEEILKNGWPVLQNVQ